MTHTLCRQYHLFLSQSCCFLREKKIPCQAYRFCYSCMKLIATVFQTTTTEYVYKYILYQDSIINLSEARFGEHNDTSFKLDVFVPSEMVQIDKKTIRPYT